MHIITFNEQENSTKNITANLNNCTTRGGIASSLVLTSCSNKKKDPSHYVGNEDGTDWKGYKSGQIQCIPEDGGYTLDLSNTEIAYSATNWVIPYKVKNSEGQVFDVKKIIGPSEKRNALVLTEILTIPNSVTSIEWGAFSYCDELTGLTIPNSVVSIGDGAFFQCSRLAGSLIIPNSVTNIGDDAFRGCARLAGSLTIGSHVTSIGGSAFNGCSGFTNITLVGFNDDPTWDVGEDIFYDWNNYSSSNVSISGGSYTADEALTYLISKGLPSNWTFA